jgi:hypothetical protein
MAERMQDGGGTRVEQAERGQAKRVEGVEEFIAGRRRGRGAATVGGHLNRTRPMGWAGGLVAAAAAAAPLALLWMLQVSNPPAP